MDLETPCPLELFVLSRDYFTVLCIEDGAHILKVFKLNATGAVAFSQLRSSLSPSPKNVATSQQRTYFILIDKINLQGIEGHVTALQPLGHGAVWLNRQLVLDFCKNDSLEADLNRQIKRRIIDDQDFLDVVQTYQTVTRT